tara:strand:+ start:458 stop:1159 length:702 start_codon:yes stop_codon:yes gene_type:complete
MKPLLNNKPTKIKRIFYLLSILFLVSCGKYNNSTEFIETFEGRYLFNSNETLEVYFKEDILKIKWRGNNMTPIKADDNSFYLKEMNEKLIFISVPKVHIELAEKREHAGEKFHFTKLKEGEKTALEYFKNKEYSKSLKAYIALQQKDSLDSTIKEWDLNKTGYKYMKANEFEKAKAIFEINIALYPEKSNVYDSMGDLFKKKKDTIKAIEYYQKSLTINPENRNAINSLKKLD